MQRALPAVLALALLAGQLGLLPLAAASHSSSWKLSRMASLDGAAQDSGVGDGDGDGKVETYVAAGPNLFQVARAGGAWVATRIAQGTWFFHLAVGDGDRDGKPEVYAVQFGELHRYRWTGSAWEGGKVLDLPAGGPITLGDLEHDGKRELYVAASNMGGGVHKVWFKDGAWRTARISDVGAASAVWIADGDRDGKRELYVGGGTKGESTVHQVERSGGAWRTTLLGDLGTGSSVAGVVAGDADRSGKGEVVAVSEDQVVAFTKTSSGWSQRVLATLPASGQDLFLGDGDGDGSKELYAAANDGHAYRVRWGSSAWAVTDMGSTGEDNLGTLALGDADRDGEVEVVAAGTRGDPAVTGVYEFDP